MSDYLITMAIGVALSFFLAATIAILMVWLDSRKKNTPRDV